MYVVFDAHLTYPNYLVHFNRYIQLSRGREGDLRVIPDSELDLVFGLGVFRVAVKVTGAVPQYLVPSLDVWWGKKVFGAAMIGHVFFLCGWYGAKCSCSCVQTPSLHSQRGYGPW